MSEKKSWDIQPNRRPQPQPPLQQPVRQERAPIQAPRSQPRPKPIKIAPKSRPRAKAPEPIPVVRPLRKEKIPQGKEREPLRERRKRARKRLQTAASILLLLLIIGFFVIVWLPAFRIQHIDASGTDAADVQSAAAQALTGKVDYVFPKNSIFFYPQNQLREALLTKFPDISAVSISRTSLDAIRITSISRETAFLWCGAAYDKSALGDAIAVQATTTSSAASSTAPTSPEQVTIQPTNCYEADSQGYVYAQANTGDLSGDLLRVYSEVIGSKDGLPLGARIASAQYIPNELQFVKAIKSLGVSITTLALRGDEADLYAHSGTRITYVIGQEEVAAQLAQSAFPSLSINDGSLEYVDLRFPGKVYYKSFNSAAQETNQ